MASKSRSGQNINHLDKIDQEVLGLKGLTDTYDGLFFLLIIPLSLVVSLISIHIDESRLNSALDLAVNPLSVLLGIGGLFLIARFAGLSIAGGENEDESTVNRIATLVASASGVTLFAIIVHRLLPVGDLSRMVGAGILLLIPISFAMLVVGRQVIDHHERLNGAKRAKSQTLPFLQKSAWVVDVVAWFSHNLLATLIWSLAMRATGAQWADSTFIWVLLTGTAMFHATQVGRLGYRGFTLGHRLAGVRVVNAQTGNLMGWKQSVVRTTLPLICVYVIILFGYEYPLGMDADVGGTKYFALVAASAIVVATSMVSFLSFSLLREVHTHGQGLLDLVCHTVSVTLKDEPAETNPQESTLTDEPQMADTR